MPAVLTWYLMYTESQLPAAGEDQEQQLLDSAVRGRAASLSQPLEQHTSTSTPVEKLAAMQLVAECCRLTSTAT